MLKERRTPFVLRLRLCTFMRAAVDLYHEPYGLTDEVAEINAEPLLATEFEAVKRTAAQGSPELSLGWCGIRRSWRERARD